MGEVYSLYKVLLHFDQDVDLILCGCHSYYYPIALLFPAVGKKSCNPLAIQVFITPNHKIVVFLATVNNTL